jgi:hypothetical protein
MRRFLFIFLSLISLLISCKTTKIEVDDNSEILSETESNVVTKTDSTSKETTFFEENERLETSDKIIIFGEGGGTYNSETGQADNVDKVVIKDKKNELTASVKIENETQKEYIEQKDSISEIIELRDVEKKEDTGNGTAWAVWVLVGAGVVIVIIIATKFFL